MQFTLATLLAIAAVATAAPAPGLPILGGGEDDGAESAPAPQPQPQGGDTTTTTTTTNSNNRVCSVENKQVCCTGLLACAVQLIGEECKGGNAYCCNTGAEKGTLINIALANCVDVL
ncbi:hypothetical protein CEP54_015561 [Fusarium duplospermum]|uniref:Hydrophobin 3 n=1 Tax=Fusarium duplospermum TaxID=1325734 RepID=A0A428NN66_9HYPO|nr:hypothetical protein CEP54_015561 [Fusarium duplospermum]